MQSARKKFRLHLPNSLMNYGRLLGERGGIDHPLPPFL